MQREKRLIDANKLWVAFDEAGLFDEGNPRHIAQELVERQPTVITLQRRCPFRTITTRKTAVSGRSETTVTDFLECLRDLCPYWAISFATDQEKCKRCDND